MYVSLLAYTHHVVPADMSIKDLKHIVRRYGNRVEVKAAAAAVERSQLEHVARCVGSVCACLYIYVMRMICTLMMSYMSCYHVLYIAINSMPFLRLLILYLSYILGLEVFTLIALYIHLDTYLF